MLLTAVLILVIDQVSKELATRLLAESRAFPSGTQICLRLIKNRAGPLGRLKNPGAFLLIWSSAVLGTVSLARFSPFFQEPVAQLGLGAALGGATGNFLDRLWRGGVIDFIDLRFWPVFNLADVAIVFGVTVAFLFFR